MKASIFLGLIVCVVWAVGVSEAQPSTGDCTVTVYDASAYSNGQSGACNCKRGILKYPTAALSQHWFAPPPTGGAGPSCGKCFRIKIYGDPYSPGWCSDDYEVVVKVADECPEQGNEFWCTTPNHFNSPVHFDLIQNVPAVQNIVNKAGRSAFRAKYCQVPCSQWAGYNDANANGQMTSEWGKCPKTNDAKAVSNCKISKQCAAGGGGSSAAGMVWAQGVNSWWVAFALQGTAVSINCGQGFVQMKPEGYKINNADVWSWQSSTYQCSKTFVVKYTDSTGTHQFTGTGTW